MDEDTSYRVYGADGTVDSYNGRGDLVGEGRWRARLSGDTCPCGKGRGGFDAPYPWHDGCWSWYCDYISQGMTSDEAMQKLTTAADEW